MDFSPDKLRKRFHQLTAAGASPMAEREELWAELTLIVGGDTEMTVKQAQAREAKVRARIKELHKVLAPIETERATIVRALKGETGTA